MPILQMPSKSVVLTFQDISKFSKNRCTSAISERLIHKSKMARCLYSFNGIIEHNTTVSVLTRSLAESTVSALRCKMHNTFSRHFSIKKMQLPKLHCHYRHHGSALSSLLVSVHVQLMCNSPSFVPLEHPRYCIFIQAFTMLQNSHDFPSPKNPGGITGTDHVYGLFLLRRGIEAISQWKQNPPLPVFID